MDLQQGGVSSRNHIYKNTQSMLQMTLSWIFPAPKVIPNLYETTPKNIEQKLAKAESLSVTAK